jgi:hypothetical protein
VVLAVDLGQQVFAARLSEAGSAKFVEGHDEIGEVIDSPADKSQAKL